MAAARLLMGVAVAAVWLGACASPPPAPQVDLTQIVAGPPDAVLERSQVALSGLGLVIIDVDPDAGQVRAQKQNVEETEWAQCANAVAFDPDGDRRRRADERELDLDLLLSATHQGDGTAVALRPRFERTYLNSFTNLEFTRRCRSTGAVEREIFERLERPTSR